LIELKFAHTCICKDIHPWCDYDQMEYVMHVIMDLNETYSSINQVLSTDPFSYITRCFS